MHNKKGFTLVEILAVVAILAVLVTLVIPNVLKTLNNSKIEVLDSEGNKLKDSAEIWIEDYCDNPIGNNKCDISYSEAITYKSEKEKRKLKYICVSTLYDSEIIDEIKFDDKLCTGVIIYDEDGKNGETYLYCGEYKNTTATNNELNLSYFEECTISATNSGTTSVTITLDANDGKVNGKEIDTITRKKNDEYGSIPTPIRPGYTFLGWYLKRDNNSDEYKITSDRKVTTTNDHILYAHWEVNNYIVTFKPNGGTVSPENKTVIFDEPYGEIPNPTRTGYEFKKWSYNGKVITKDTIVSVPNDHDILANYIPNFYTITYVTNSDSKCLEDEIEYDNEIVLDISLSKLGYTFKGWYTDSGLTNQLSDSSGNLLQNVSGYTNSDGKWIKASNVTVYAKWTPITYTIAYNANGGTGTISSSSHTYDNEKTLTANSFAKTGYTFIGWKDNSGNTYSDKQSVKNLTTTNNATITLSAQWKANTYYVAYDGNGATSGSMSNSTHTFGTNGSLTTNSFVKTGYTFIGWNRSRDGSGESFSNGMNVISLTSTDKQTVTIYAQWKANTYYVAYDGNGATSGSMSNSTHTYATYSNLTKNGFNKSGYEFIGWNTQQDGSGNSFSDSDSVGYLTSYNNKTITLYAQWKANTYYVAYDGNGATSGSTSATTCYYGQNCTLATNGYSRSDYSFYKWNTDPNGNGTFYDNGSTYSGNKPITLYAIWKNTNVASDVNVAMYLTYGYSCTHNSGENDYTPKLDASHEWEPFYNQTGVYMPGKPSGTNKYPWRIMVIEVPFNPGETASSLTFTFTGACSNKRGSESITSCDCGNSSNCTSENSISPLWSGVGETTSRDGIIKDLTGKCMYSNLGLYNNDTTSTYILSAYHGPNNVVFNRTFSGGTEGRNYYLYLFTGPDFNFPMAMSTWRITKN